eukprot:CAMPEP_0176315340 /NCGR_PEP_ID=MMETSP0121_2-20121125/68153_1 /TAXON_ID=160619 /ORGANISM="Kryptoperidinium foliaceum, Strain CCMP 1326" /LENGTH=96 /DNA_ID=CAMNT_0017657489 /DNA_START=116 /DNA_END=403 /DNA_ORIENTATION=-
MRREAFRPSSASADRWCPDGVQVPADVVQQAATCVNLRARHGLQALDVPAQRRLVITASTLGGLAEHRHTSRQGALHRLLQQPHVLALAGAGSRAE